ncbi:MAG: periplasmic-type flagellar collar protein FlcA, partial [Spirochaetia bacterium]
MPSREDIQQFDRNLMDLGDEPAVLAEWGETYEPAQAPESGLADDLSDLLGGGTESGGAAESGG